MAGQHEERVGQRLGNYRLLRLLGRGGFAEVYVGEHVYLQSLAAIKLLHTRLTEQQAADFMQEARTLVRLSHPHIVRVLDFAVQEGIPFLVMEYAPRGTLRTRHATKAPVPLETAVSYVQQVASALQYAHQQRIIHRDVKPENMLLNEREEVLLSDFGLALFAPQTLSASTQEMAKPMAGTIPYMAPEQIRGKPRAASDQYALAVVVYEWLCGKQPFTGSFFEIVTQHLWQQPPFLREQVPHLSSALEEVVLRALAKDPKQRFASVQDFASALVQSAHAQAAPSVHVAPALPTGAATAEPADPYRTVSVAVLQEPSSSAPVSVLAAPTSATGEQAGMTIPVAEGSLPEALGKLAVVTPATPLVGRTGECAQLLAIWQKAAAGHPHLLLLAGEAGIGKTRLAEELLTEVSRQGLTTASARCYAAEGELAYTPVATWLRSEPFYTALRGLEGIWLSEVARLVPEVLLERADLAAPSPLNASWQRQRLFEALARAILAAHQPLLLLLDDIQWCDRETLNWLHYLLRFDPQARLLIVGTLRAEELTGEPPLQSLLAALRREGQLTQISLEGLTAAETATLAAQLAGRELDPEVATRLYQDTEGNALFVVETVRMELAEAADREREGLSGREPGTTQQTGLLPTIQAVISARLEQLSTQARELVSVASVIGRAFSFEVLSAASGGDDEAIVEALDELGQRRIVREQENDSYDFSHDKLREGAYAALSRARRLLLHRRVAEALETVYVANTDTLERLSGQIAVHYEQAGLAERAIPYFRRAAEGAQRIYANAEALAAYRRALELLKTLPLNEARGELIAQLYEQVGNILDLTVQLDESRAAYQNALTFVPQHDLIWQACLYRRISSSEFEHEKSQQALDMAEVLLGREPTDVTSPWWHEWIELQLCRMRLYYNWAKLPELVALVEKARPIIEQHGDPTQRASFFVNLTLVHYRRNRYIPSEETLQYHKVALAAMQESGKPIAIGMAHFQLGFGYLWYGELDKAEEQFQVAHALAERTGDRLLQARCLTYLTVTYRKRGEVEHVGRCASQALAIATATMMTEYISMARGNMAWVAWREGNMVEVQKHGQAALETFDPGEEPFMWTALWPLIGVAVVQHQLVGAVAYARMLLAPVQQRLPDALTALLEEVIQAWDSGQPETAGDRLNQATTLAQQMGYL